MRLKNPELGIFLKAVEDSFSPNDISVLLLSRFNIKYFSVTGSTEPWPVQVMNVHLYFDQRNTSERLVVALRDARPEVPELAAVADSLGYTVRPATAGLEVLVSRPDNPYQDVDAFMAGFAKCGAAVCQVLVGGMTGTGPLIAPGIVITNRHVVAAAMDTNDKLTQAAVCRFDFKTNGARSYTTPATDIRAREVLSSSPHDPSDTVAGPMTTSTASLDYALLKLEREIDAIPVAGQGDPRGFVNPDSGATVLTDGGVLILQHPGGQPMKVDLGSVTDTAPARLRHTVNTEPGSSGAPVFDASLNMVAIHHAGQKNGPGPSQTYNQAIPLGPILAHARSAGVAI